MGLRITKKKFAAKKPKGKALKAIPRNGVIEEVHTKRLEEDENTGVEIRSSTVLSSLTKEQPRLRELIQMALEALPLHYRRESRMVETKLMEAAQWCEQTYLVSTT